MSFICKCLGYVKGTPWPIPKKVPGYVACIYANNYKRCVSCRCVLGAVHIKCPKCSGYAKGMATP